LTVWENMRRAAASKLLKTCLSITGLQALTAAKHLRTSADQSDPTPLIFTDH
jgi:hypothetical protein